MKRRKYAGAWGNLQTDGGNSFVAEKQRPWSPKPLVNLAGSVRNFDLAADRKRIVALMPADKAEDPGVASHVSFMLNCFDELERRVPKAGQ